MKRTRKKSLKKSLVSKSTLNELGFDDDLLVKAKYVSRKKKGNKWVYDYGDDKKGSKKGIPKGDEKKQVIIASFERRANVPQKKIVEAILTGKSNNEITEITEGMSDRHETIIFEGLANSLMLKENGVDLKSAYSDKSFHEFVSAIQSGVKELYSKGGKTEKKEEGGKSKEASAVLQIMDSQENPNYTTALNEVVKKTGIDKAKLEKELDKYI